MGKGKDKKKKNKRQKAARASKTAFHVSKPIQAENSSVAGQELQDGPSESDGA